MQDKKKVAFQFVLNTFECDKNNIDIHEEIIDIKKCSDQFFLNS